MKSVPNLKETTCNRVLSLANLKTGACNFISKKTLLQLFPCQFSELFQNNYSMLLNSLLFSTKDHIYIWLLVLIKSCQINFIFLGSTLTPLYRPGQITRPIGIGRAWARKTSETGPIFWGHTFCLIKRKKQIYKFQTNR